MQIHELTYKLLKVIQRKNDDKYKYTKVLTLEDASAGRWGHRSTKESPRNGQKPWELGIGGEGEADLTFVLFYTICC